MATEILKDDHQKLAELLERLQTALQDGSEGWFELLDRFWALLAMHIRAEHLCLFPSILQADRGLFGGGGMPSIEVVERAIARLKSDHNFFMDELAEAVKTSRELLAKPPEEQIAPDKFDSIKTRVSAVALRLESHNVLEEEQVYIWPQQILGPNDLDDLNMAMKRELENFPSRIEEA
jgi:iron-sulfur cluster repair protein YtfE (RIC family)